MGVGSKYVCKNMVGEGHFTKAYLAEDLTTRSPVCLKCHRALTVEALSDLIVISRRVETYDPNCYHFPRIIDAFYDLVGYTVESIVEGQNCLALMHSNPKFFRDMDNLRVVACDTLKG